MDRAVSLYTKSIDRQKQRLELASILGSFMNKSKVLKKRVNLSGRQRMLIQRMTKLALLIESNINKNRNIERLRSYSSLYDKTLNAFYRGDKELDCTPTEDKSIREKIEAVKREWEPFYREIMKIVDGKGDSRDSIKYIVENNEKLLKLSDELVKAYEKSNKTQNFLR